MTVDSNYTKRTYIADGTTTTFPWTSDYDKTYKSLVVTSIDENGDVLNTYTEDTDYTIVNSSVVFFVAPVSGTRIHIDRHTYRGQQVTFIEGEDFPAKDYENSLDRLFMIDQEQDKALDREKSERVFSDGVLQENIDAEALARSSADTTLDTAITGEANRAKGVEGTLSNLTTTTKSNLVAAINEVDSHADSISSTISGYGNIVTHNVSEFATAAQGAKADTAVQPADLSGYQTKSNLVTSVSSGSTDAQYPSAKLLYNQLATKQGTLTFDSAPTSSSTNPVTSGGVYTALGNKQDTSNLVTSISGGSTDTQYPSAKLLYDQLAAKQATLVSGTNIKTINNTSLLGSGDITISGGGGLQQPIYIKDVSVTNSSDSPAASLFVHLTDDYNVSYDANIAYVPIVFIRYEGLSQYIQEVYVNQNTSTSKYRLVLKSSDTNDYKIPVGVGSYLDVFLFPVKPIANADSNQKYFGAINNGNPLYQKANLVTSISSSSTDVQYPSAKCVYDIVGDIETLLQNV